MLDFDFVALEILREQIRKSGVREYDNAEVRAAITAAAVEMATALLFEVVTPMAVTNVFREQTGTVKTWKSSGGDGAMTPTSLANGAYYEGAKIDLGATRAQVYAVYLDVELAATPTAGNPISVWFNFSSSGTAGTDNGGGCSGTDAAYTGYSSNAAASVLQLVSAGDGKVTTQSTATVQKRIFVGHVVATDRYVSPVILNGSGAAFHSTITNFQLRIVPIELTSEPS